MDSAKWNRKVQTIPATPEDEKETVQCTHYLYKVYYVILHNSL